MVSAVGAVLPVEAVHSIDELSARLSPRDDPESILHRVKSSVACALTERVPVSIGVAPSAWLAKCAAEAHKPSAAVVWRRDDLPTVYAGLELEDLPGAGPRISARLRAAGLTTVEAIYSASRSRVVAAWGSIEGERVRLALRGEDVPARVTRRRSVAHGRVLTGRDRCWREARQIVRWLALCALRRCAEARLVLLRVRLEAATLGCVERGGVGRLDSFGYERDLLRTVSALWEEGQASGPADPPVRVGVVLENLREARPCTYLSAAPAHLRTVTRRLFRSHSSTLASSFCSLHFAHAHTRFQCWSLPERDFATTWSRVTGARRRRSRAFSPSATPLRWSPSSAQCLLPLEFGTRTRDVPCRSSLILAHLIRRRDPTQQSSCVRYTRLWPASLV